jgi:hypothetical protein
MKMRASRLAVSLALCSLLGGSARAAPVVTWGVYESGDKAQAAGYAPNVNPDDVFCGLLQVQGNFEWPGHGQAWVANIKGGWRLHARAGNSGSDMWVVAGCDRYSRYSNRVDPVRASFWSYQGWEQYWFTLRAWSTGSDGSYIGNHLVPMWGNDAVCYLTGVEGVLNGGGEYISISDGVGTGSGQSFLDVRNAARRIESFTQGRSECVALHRFTYQPRYLYSVAQGQSDVRMIPDSAGTCFLSGIAGRFRGGGELAAVYSSGGYQWLAVRSMQEGVSASAVCIPY